MNNNRQDIDDSILQSAAAWVARLQSRDATMVDREAFEAWRVENPEHARAYDDLRKLWADLEDVPIPPERLGRLRALRRRKTSGIVALCLTAGVAAVLMTTPYADRWRADYYTGVGEVRRVTLADGTQVDLNTDTALAVRFDEGRRRIELLRGEAFFDVMKDPRRSFIVEEGTITATALGTHYSVKAATGSLSPDVQVEEGRVQVWTTGQDVVLGAGDVATIDREGRLALAKADVAARAAWRDGKLVFSRRPLRQVLATLERYRHGRILLMDGAVGDLEVSGIFDLHDTDDALRVLEASLPLSVMRLSDLMVVVRSR